MTETVGCESDTETAITALRRSGGQMRLTRTMIVEDVEEGMAVAESCGTTDPIVGLLGEVRIFKRKDRLPRPVG